MATAHVPVSIAVDDRRGNRPDLTLVALQVLLSGLGLIMIYSATRSRSNGPRPSRPSPSNGRRSS
jgi:cell division protein FtsW (lipid II flippase)